MKTAIQFGAGNIGRGFIGALLNGAGYDVIFADINEKVIDKLNEDKKYTVFVYDTEKSEQVIEGVSGANTAKPEIFDAILKADIITTAVGPLVLKIISQTLAKGIENRMEQGVSTHLNIIACENAVNASTQLKDYVFEHLSEEGKAYAQKFVGFPNCAVDRIVPPVTTENFVDVIVEKYFEWDVNENEFSGEIPEIPGMTLVSNLVAYTERKLFTLNCGHAICAYLGFLKGQKTVDESINDPEIFEIVRGAMVESGDALIKKYDFDREAHTKYIDKILNRFKNTHLNDDLFRVGREPMRKLSPNDRLVKPLITASEYGFSVSNLTKGIGAALNFVSENDKQSLELKEKIDTLGVKAAFAEISGVTDEKILESVENAYISFKK